MVSYLKDRLEANGQAGTVLFTVSGHGNVDPRDGCQPDPNVVHRLGHDLAELIAAALPALAPVSGDEVNAAREPWEFATTWDVDESMRLGIYFPHAGQGKPVTTAIAALRAGELVLLGLPGEAVSEYRALFQRRSPFARTLLLSVVNDFVGYLPTDQILDQGAYEANVSPLRPIQAALTERVDEVLEHLR